MEARSVEADLLFKGGRVVLPDAVYELDIAVAGGKIVALLGRGEYFPAREVVDLSGLVVLPGVIDPHVHMRDPGREDREDFTSGTRAAAMGGVTTVLEHPNTIPPVASPADLEAKRQHLEPKSYVDFGLYGAGGADNLAEIAPLAQAGVVAFKTFLQDPPPGREEEYRGLCVTDDGDLYALMRKVRETGLLLAVHAENNAIIRRLKQEMVAAGDTRGDAHERSRPVVCEVEAISRVCLLAGATGCRVYIPHISSGSGALAGAEARRRGVVVTLETCPQYLFFTAEDLNRHGPYAKMDPPLRRREEQDLLWRCVQDGTIDTIGSDHAPHLGTDKEKGRDNIFAAPSGAPGVELALPLMLTGVARERLDFPCLARLMSYNTARLYGLYPRKGLIWAGADADLTVVDPQVRWVIEPARLATKARDAAAMFAGFEITGRPVMTVVRGTVVMREGEVLVPPGHGCPISPLHPPAARRC